ncbi:hypothetical protein THAOC_22911, partial [Thalassiosira oceanica]
TLTLTKRRMGWAGWRKGDVDDGLGWSYNTDTDKARDGSDLVILWCWLGLKSVELEPVGGLDSASVAAPITLF